MGGHYIWGKAQGTAIIAGATGAFTLGFGTIAGAETIGAALGLTASTVATGGIVLILIGVAGLGAYVYNEFNNNVDPNN